MSEPRGSITFTLNLSRINSLQLRSMREQIKRARHAHYTDLAIRINGQTEMHECDWIKHLVEQTAKDRT